VHGYLDNLRQMQRLTVGALGNLFAATKAVRDNECILRSLAHRRE
jgi:hypothetical protein